MPPLVQKILSVLAGLLAGGVSVQIVQLISTRLHPPPEGVDTTDMEQLAEWVKELPLLAFVLVLASWAAGCFVGTYVARQLSPQQRSLVPSLLVAVFFTLSTIAMLVMLPHPWWMWPAGILACLVFSLLGMALAAPREHVVQTQHLVRAPRDKVFQTLAQVENFAKAVEGIDEIEFLTEQKYGVGTKFKETRTMNGRQATTELEVTELVENDSVRIVSEAGGTLWDTVFRVEQEGEEVNMRMRMDVRPHNLAARFITPLILNFVQQAVESDMQAVKTYCEEQST